METYECKNMIKIDMFIHGLFLQYAFWFRRRKMQHIDASLQRVDDGMQPACIANVARLKA